MFSFFDGLACQLAHRRHATLWLSWGGVGWGGAMTFMSTCPHTSCYVIVLFSCTCTHTSCYVMVIFSCTCSHTSCYVMVIFSCTCSHTSCYAMVVFSCTCTHTHTRHATLWLSWGGVGWGGVGWGNNVHVNLHTHVMLRYCYVLLHLHTHVMLRYGDLLLHLLTHVMLRYGDLLLHLLTHVMLRYGDLLLHLHTHVMRTIVFADGNRAWESHAKSLKIKHAKVSHQNKEWTKQMRRTSFFFLSTVAGTQIADRWWKGLSKTVVWWSQHKRTPWIGKVSVGENLWDHWHLTGFSKNFARPSKQWSASEKKEKKCCIPKKHELMSKNEVVLEIFKTLFFTSTWEKMTFRCSENDIFVDEKLLKPYGRLWVGNRVVVLLLVLSCIIIIV